MEQVEQGQFDKVVDQLMGTATEKKDVPQAKIDSFVTSLDAVQKAALERFLEGKTDERAGALRARMEALKGSVSPSTDAVSTGIDTAPDISGPAQKVIGALDRGIAKITASGKLTEIANKIGFKGEIGPAQLEFVKNFFLGYAAKVFEGVTASLKKVNPTADLTKILNLPLELRLLNIKDPIQKEKYRAAYLKRAKETNGVFVAPTIEEALHPEQTASATAPSADNKPAAAPETSPNGEKVTDAKRTVKLTDGTIFDIQRGPDKKTIVSAGGNKAEVKVAGAETLDVFALDAKDQAKASVSVKLTDNRVISIDGETLRNAVQKKDKTIAASGATIELTEIKNS